jgi:hypothetical protein
LHHFTAGDPEFKSRSGIDKQIQKLKADPEMKSRSRNEKQIWK